MFEPISVRAYIYLYVANNPSEKKQEVEERIRETLSVALSGKKCSCGNPIWVVGGADAGHYCFTCITGETIPKDDYEIDEHLNYLKAQSNT
ncbi:hypothetical protein SAMN05216464_108110 [Mucilaginibacter pineti]|uniref:Uncharacterized protein n=1 Tax=Mucilaginibacter pineti TaxID=1391627 RepID=A0A1G7EPC2_9SPHI|nr:hypothetical protein [Mucilaginibacter pineti]SDE65538.1 hypothetical protein SAMN05216464_108110 [Mucilaginibacter pineti]